MNGYHSVNINTTQHGCLTQAEVDIVIPVFNRIDYLEATIASVLRQTYPYWTLTIVDDGSEEEITLPTCLASDERVKLIRQTNQGNAAARNCGIAQGKGEYVICLDSDDVWLPEMLERCVREMATHPEVDVVYTQWLPIDGNDVLLSEIAEPSPCTGNPLEALLLGYPILPSSALVRRRCFETWGMYEPGLDDWELWLRWTARGCQFRCIPVPLVRYRRHERNLSSNWSQRRAVHQTTLDRFFASEEARTVTLPWRARAYAHHHLCFAVLAQRAGRVIEAREELYHAVINYPDYLRDLDFHTRLACSHEERNGQRPNLERAQATLEDGLDHLFAHDDLPRAVRRQYRSSRGWAYLALARLAYAHLYPSGITCSYLLRSLCWWPAICWRSDWLLWLARALVGHTTIQRIKMLISAARPGALHQAP